MRVEDFLREACMGGPGLSGYAFQADVYCVYCGRQIIAKQAPIEAPHIDSMADLICSDSEHIPQPIFFGESDQAQHCAQCGEYLYGHDEEEE